MEEKLEIFKKKYMPNPEDFEFDLKEDYYYKVEIKKEYEKDLSKYITFLRWTALDHGPFKFLKILREDKKLRELKNLLLLRYRNNDVNRDYCAFFEYKDFKWRISLRNLDLNKLDVRVFTSNNWINVSEDGFEYPELIREIEIIKNDLIENIINNTAERIEILLEREKSNERED